jgi:hypothetical protein
MIHESIDLSPLSDLPLTREDERYILECLRQGGVGDTRPVLAAYASCWAAAAQGTPERQRENAGRRAANTFLREALGVAPGASRSH